MNPRLARLAAGHALGWLVAANAVGVLLAALLLWPQLNTPLAPFTYGRWMPLHLDWQLYGWCALPLVGVLAAWMLAPEDVAGVRETGVALAAWSVALALGGASWLAGTVSGKLFLDWSGWTRPLLPLAMTLLWSVLGARLWARRRTLSAGGLAARVAVLALLLAVPSVLYWATSRAVYPSVNPDSGGATGASLLGSTLALVAIAGWLPVALGLPATGNDACRAAWRSGDTPGPAVCNVIRYKRHGRRDRRGREPFWLALAGSAAVWIAINHGNVSHHAAAQITALGTLLIWAPLLWIYFRAFAWPAAAWRWLGAAFVWWTLLLVSGWITFLPGVSERVKFTNFLVAHAHLAMAGVVTNLGVALLAALGRTPGGGRRAFIAWQAGNAAHLAALAGLGAGEIADPAGFFGGERWATPLLATRLAAGVVMLGASVAWLGEERA